MNEFKVGQKITCLSDKNDGIDGVPFGITNGETYIIEGFTSCKNCGRQMVLLEGVDSGSKKECLCSSVPTLPPNAFLIDRFYVSVVDRETNKDKEIHFYQTKKRKEKIEKIHKQINKTNSIIVDLLTIVYKYIKNLFISYFYVDEKEQKDKL